MLDNVTPEECKRLFKEMHKYNIRLAPCLRGRWNATAHLGARMASVRQCLDPVDAVKKCLAKIKLIENDLRKNGVIDTKKGG